MVECLPAMSEFGTGQVTLFTAATASQQKRPTEHEIRKWQDRLDSYAARVLDSANVQVATKVDYNANIPVPQRILNAARNAGAGYIIIANRGQRKLREVLLGSTVTALLQQTDLPVFLIKLRLDRKAGESVGSSDSGDSGNSSDGSNSGNSGDGGKSGNSGDGSKSGNSGDGLTLRCTASCHDVLEHILYPTDFSDTARIAFDVLQRLAGGPSKRITLFHVQASGKVDLTNAAQLEKFNRIDRDRLETLSRELRDHTRVDVDIALGQGPAARLIVDKARSIKSTLIVMGSQGRGYISDLFLGGVTYHVLRNTPVPVLVIPARRLSIRSNDPAMPGITSNE